MSGTWMKYSKLLATLKTKLIVGYGHGALHKAKAQLTAVGTSDTAKIITPRVVMPTIRAYY